jgi:hypothetical protein
MATVILVKPSEELSGYQLTEIGATGADRVVKASTRPLTEKLHTVD